MDIVLPPLRLTGADVLTDSAFQRRSIALADGRITSDSLPEVNLSGYWLVPGIIDLHGDAFERHLSPRPTAPFEKSLGLASTDRELAANGVTTAWLAQCWSWEGGIRGEDYAEAVMAALAEYRVRALCDMRIQIRCETHMVDSADRLLAAIEDYGVDYVVFNNHLPEALEAWDKTPLKVEAWARQAGRSGEDYIADVRAAAAREPQVFRHLARLAEAFDRMGVAYGSHDDPDAETRERYRMIGARIAEFPTHRGAAFTAKAMGDPVIMGAPNVVRGGSQSGNIAAAALIAEGLCDALVSDYYYPALAQSAWTLADKGLLDFAAAWALISTKPAQILGLRDRGSLSFGKRADLVVMNPETRAIEATISGGRLTYLAGEAGRRFLSQAQVARIAAE